MNLDQLIKGLERGPISEGMQLIKEWFLSEEHGTIGIAPSERLVDEVLFCILARQLAYDRTGTPRVHVQYPESGNMLKTLKAISIPGTVMQVNRKIKNLHGVCYVKNGASMKMMDQAKGFASACFVSSNEPSAVFVS